MALFTVIDGGFVLHVAKSAVAVMRRGMRIGADFVCLFNHCSPRMTLYARIFIRVLRIGFVWAMTHFALHSSSDMSIGAKFFGCANAV